MQNGFGTRLVSYTYDAWGNHVVTPYNDGENIIAVANNPIRYRGYYYDTDLGLYYLQTRYYDSNTGRFINADSVMSGANGSLQGSNLYVYCFNNPISMVDSSGSWPKWVEDAAGWVDDNIIQPAVNFVQNVAKDISNYDPNNESEQKVLDAKVFSSYKGAFVLKLPGKNAFSLGILFIGNGYSGDNVVKHEYGHYRQLQDMGLLSYLSDIVAPSVTAFWLDKCGKLTYDYFGSPWEHDADVRGGVVYRTENNTPWPSDAPNSFSELIPLFFK